MITYRILWAFNVGIELFFLFLFARALMGQQDRDYRLLMGMLIVLPPALMTLAAMLRNENCLQTAKLVLGILAFPALVYGLFVCWTLA